MPQVLRAYFIAGFVALSALLLAVGTAWAITPRVAPSGWFHGVLLVSSAILLFVAGVGRLGWNVQTWSGNTPTERFNLWTFRGLSFVGLYLLLLSRALGWF